VQPRQALCVTRLKNFLGRSADERRLMVEALVLLPVARLSLAVCGYAPTRALFEILSRIPGPRTNEARARDLPSLINQVTHAAARHAVCQTTCLRRSLVVWTLLRQQGFRPTLRFGARNTDGKFDAHAWVELDGKVFDPTFGDTHTFVPFPCTSAP
jgi:hypothetical protein